MMPQSLSSTAGVIKRNIRYSQPSLSGIENHVRYSRHLSFQYKRTPSNKRLRLIIHTTIRSPKNNRHQKENKSTHSISTIRQKKINNSNVTSNSVKARRSPSRSLSINKDTRRHRSLPTSIHNSRSNNHVITYSQGKTDYLSKTKDKVKNNTESVLERQHFPSSSNRNLTNNNSSLFLNDNKTKTTTHLWSNTKDFHEDSKRKKKKRCPGGYPCLLACLLTALLLGIAIAAALVTTLIKSQPTTVSTTTATISTTLTTVSSTTMISTTISTILPTTTMASTTSTTLATTTITTTISSTVASTSVTTTLSTILTTTAPTTITSTICSTPTSTAFYYSSATGTYTAATYNYTAASTGTAVLEFGFASTGANKYAYLDDVSIVDTTASNSEMLTNGGFENGTLVGWQALCTSSCMSTPGALTTPPSCNTGMFCYKDGCKGGLDFLRQTFTTTIGHVYTLNFWVNVGPGSNVYVRIF